MAQVIYKYKKGNAAKRSSKKAKKSTAKKADEKSKGKVNQAAAAPVPTVATPDWKVARDYEIAIAGNRYDSRILKSQVITSNDYLQFKQGLNLSNQELNLLDNWTSAYLDGLTSGTMYIEDNKIVDTTNVRKNNGVYNKKAKTTEELENNASLLATAYILDRFKITAPFDKVAARNKYKFDIENTIAQDYASKEFDLGAFELLDSEDAKTGKRGTKNRIERLAKAFESEGVKIYEQLEYRDLFDWKGKDFNENQSNAKKVADNLLAIAKGLRDGKVDPNDKRLMGETGLGIDFIDQFLNEETEKSREIAAKEAAEKAAAQQAAQNGSGNTGSVDSGLSTTQVSVPSGVADGYYFKYPWSVPVFVKSGQIVQNPDADEATKNLALQKRKEWMEVYKIKDDDHLLADVKQAGYNYVADISKAFDHADGIEVHAYSTAFGAPTAFTVYDTNKNKAYTGRQLSLGPDKKWRLLFTNEEGQQRYKIIGTYNANSVSNSFVREYRNESAPKNLSSRSQVKNYMTGMTESAKRATHLSERHAIKDVIKWLLKSGYTTIYNENTGKYGNKLLAGNNYIVPTDDDGDPITNAGVLQIRMRNNGEFTIGSNQYSTDTYFNSDFNNINGVGWFARIPKKHDGGVLKAFSGLQFNSVEQIKAQQEANKKAAYAKVNEYWESQHKPSAPSASFNGFENSKQELLSGMQLTGTDYARLSGALADVVSAAGGFIPGLHIASTAVGIGSSVTEFVADIIDLASGREGSQGLLSSIGEFALNTGMDLVSLLPAGKSAKLSKGLTTIATYAPMIAGAIQTGMIVSDPNEIKSLKNTWDKVTSLEFSSLGTKDYYNIAYVLRTALGINNATRQFVTKPSKTGTRTIKGTVKTADGNKEIKTSVSSSKFKTFSTNQKMAKEALAAEANRQRSEYVKEASTKSGKKGDKNKKNSNPKFTADDVEVKTGWFRKVSNTVDREEVKTWQPKRIFENFLGMGNKGIHTLSDKQIMSKWEDSGKWTISKERLDEVEKDKLEKPYKYTEVKEVIKGGKKSKEKGSEKPDAKSESKSSEEAKPASESKQSSEEKQSLIQSAIQKGKNLFKIGKPGGSQSENAKKKKVPTNNSIPKEENIVKKIVNSISNRVNKSMSKSASKKQLSREERLEQLYQNKNIMNLVGRKLRRDDPKRFGSASKQQITEASKKFIAKNYGKPVNLFGNKMILKRTGGLVLKLNEGNKVTANPPAEGLTIEDGKVDIPEVTPPSVNWDEYKKIDFLQDIRKVYDQWTAANPGKDITDFVDYYNGQIDIIGNKDAKSDDRLKAFGTIYSSLNPDGKVENLKVNQYADDKINENNRKFYLDDNANYSLFVGKDGKLSYKSSNSFGTKLFGTNPSQIKPNWSTALNLAGVAVSNAGVRRQTDILKKLRPTLTSTYYKKYSERGDFMPYLQALRDVGAMNTSMSVPFTSKMETAIGTKLKSYSVGADTIQKAVIHNSDKYAASQKEADTVRNDNIKNEVENANNNAKAINAIETNNIINEAKESANVYENWRTFLHGAANEQKSNSALEYGYNKQESANNLAFEMEQALNRYDQQIVQSIKTKATFATFKTRYEAANQGKKVEDLSDSELMEKYFELYPGEKQSYQLGKARIQNTYNNKMMQIARMDIPNLLWQRRVPASTTDLITGQPVHRSGGKLTAQEKRKLQALKDFNKAAREDLKEYNRNARAGAARFAKNINNLSKESKMILKAALQL